MFSKISKRIWPQKIPQGVAMQKYTFLDQGGYFGRHGLLFWGIYGQLFFKGWITGKIGWKLCGFWSYRGKSGVAVKDGELILWGMKAMPYTLYFNDLNHIKTSLFERNCLYIHRNPYKLPINHTVACMLLYTYLIPEGRHSSSGGRSTMHLPTPRSSKQGDFASSWHHPTKIF